MHSSRTVFSDTAVCSFRYFAVYSLRMSTLNGAIMSNVSARKPFCSLMTSDNSRSSSVVIAIRLQANDRGIVVRKTFYYLRNFLTLLHVPAECSLGTYIRGAGPLQVPCEVFSGRKGRLFSFVFLFMQTHFFCVLVRSPKVRPGRLMS
jgi:hypothetical protein